MKKITKKPLKKYQDAGTVASNDRKLISYNPPSKPVNSGTVKSRKNILGQTVQKSTTVSSDSFYDNLGGSKTVDKTKSVFNKKGDLVREKIKRTVTGPDGETFKTTIRKTPKGVKVGKTRLVNSKVGGSIKSKKK